MAGLFKKIGLAGDRLLKSWHQQIEGLRLRLGGSSKTKRCDALCRDDGIPGFFGILWDPGICKARQVREARSGQRAAEGSDLGSVGLVDLETNGSKLRKAKTFRAKTGGGWVCERMDELLMFQWEKHQAEAPLLLYIMYMSIIYLKHIHISS